MNRENSQYAEKAALGGLRPYIFRIGHRPPVLPEYPSTYPHTADTDRDWIQSVLNWSVDHGYYFDAQYLASELFIRSGDAQSRGIDETVAVASELVSRFYDPVE